MKTNTYHQRRPSLPINAKQKTIIKMAQGLLGLSDADYRDMLETRFQVRSCTALSYDQASEFIRELEGKGFTLKPRETGAGASRPGGGKTKPGGMKTTRPAIPRKGNAAKVVALVTPDEVAKISAVANLIQWRETNGLALFLEKRMGLKDGRIRTSAEACRAIEGLKKMFENGMKKAHGPAWWLMDFDSAQSPDPERSRRVREYIRLHCPEEWR